MSENPELSEFYKHVEELKKHETEMKECYKEIGHEGTVYGVENLFQDFSSLMEKHDGDL